MKRYEESLLELEDDNSLSFLFKLNKEKNHLFEQTKLDSQLVTIENPILFGKVNLQNNPILPKKELLVPQSDMMVFSFVSELIEKFRNDMSFARMRGVVSDMNPSLFLIEVKKEFVDVEQEYDNHISSILQAFKKRSRHQHVVYKGFNKTKQDVKNKYSFLKFVEEEFFVGNVLNDMPLTDYSYHKSNINSNLFSGIVFEIDDAEYDDEQYKFEMYYDNSDFQYFINSANKFGFRIDKNIPWRLYVDLKSSIVSETFQKKYRQPIDKIFCSLYNTIIIDINNNLLNDLYKLANNCNINIYSNKEIQKFNHRLYNKENNT